MKAYLITTGTIFAVVTVLHVARMAGEMRNQFTTDPSQAWSYVLLTLVTAALSIWAFRLLPRLPRSAARPPDAS